MQKENNSYVADQLRRFLGPDAAATYHANPDDGKAESPALCGTQVVFKISSFKQNMNLKIFGLKKITENQRLSKYLIYIPPWKSQNSTTYQQLYNAQRKLE